MIINGYHSGRWNCISHLWPLLVFCFCISGIVKIVKLGNGCESWPKCFHLDEFMKLDQDCDCDRKLSVQKSLNFVLIFWAPHWSQSTMQDMPDDRRLPPKRPSHCPRHLHPPCSGWQSRKKSAIGNRIGKKGRIGRECNGKSRNPAKSWSAIERVMAKVAVTADCFLRKMAGGGFANR